MMASHGCGQRIGFGRFLGLAALVGLALGGVPGQARACHIHHHARAATEASSANSTVQSQQILNPTSMVPQVPPLTSTATSTPPPTITPTVATVPPAPVPVPVPVVATPLTPSPVANPPAAEAIAPTTIAPTVSTWQNTGTPTCSCTCPITPPSNVPVIYPPTAGEGINPPGTPSSLQPPAASNVTTPEPSTIISALVMVGAAAIYRRRSRQSF